MDGDRDRHVYVSRGLVIVTRVLLACAVVFGILTLTASAYYAFGMDSDSESLFRAAQAACFTTEGAESVERCAPVTRATADGETLTFLSLIGFVSWASVILLAALSAWLLLRLLPKTSRGSREVPRWVAWTFVACCGWLLLSPLDKWWDEEYAEGLSDRATGVLSQYLPAVVGQSSARVWLGSSDAVYAAVGRLIGQAFVVWTIAMLVVAVAWLAVPATRRAPAG